MKTKKKPYKLIKTVDTVEQVPVLRDQITGQEWKTAISVAV
jgi:hypothetical protein